jgi:hypothetical protein
MKTYVKQMINKGATDQQISEYLTEINGKIPFSYIDPVTRKITTKLKTTLPLPHGITPIIKQSNKVTISPQSPRQPVTPIVSNQLTPKVSISQQLPKTQLPLQPHLSQTQILQL